MATNQKVTLVLGGSGKTGPRLLTFAEAIAEIAGATGRKIRCGQIPIDEYASTLAAVGVPAEFVSPMRHLFTAVLDGRNGHLMDGVQRALGRTPRVLADHARATAAAGAWNP